MGYLDVRDDTFAAHDIHISVCPECGTVQNPDDFTGSEYYDGYDYAVSATPLMRRFYSRLTRELMNTYGVKAGDSILEIGSSDGGMLAECLDNGMRVLGFEPSHRLADIAESKGITTHRDLFSSETAQDIPQELRPFRLALSFYTLDHCPDPNEFLKAIHSVLDQNSGLLILEIHDLSQIVQRSEACLFCHEHTIYLDQRTMELVLNRNGFTVLDFELVPESERRGNSLLVLARPTKPGDDNRQSVNREETKSSLPLLDDAIRQAHQRFSQYVKQAQEEGRTICGYGASARATTTLHLAGLTDEDVLYVCDKNKALQGKFLPGSRIPVVGKEELATRPCDEIIVFAYGYMDEIRNELEKTLDYTPVMTSMLDVLQGTTA